MSKSENSPKPRAIVCEDEKDMYIRLRQLLEDYGYECDDMVHNQESLENKLANAVREGKFYNIVLIDVDLTRAKERRSGIEIYESLRATYSYENYLIYTRRPTKEYRQEINRLFRNRDVEFILLDERLSDQVLALQFERFFRATDPTSVFLVHGRNKRKNQKIRTFLREGMGLNIIEWEDARKQSQSPYIYDIVVQGIDMSQATVVLFTDDEEVHLRKEFYDKKDPEDALNDRGRNRRQSRSNVYIEAGYAEGLRPNRTIFVEWPDNSRDFSHPTDFAGNHCIRFKDDEQTRDVLKQRLEAAHCILAPHKKWKTLSLTKRPS